MEEQRTVSAEKDVFQIRLAGFLTFRQMDKAAVKIEEGVREICIGLHLRAVQGVAGCRAGAENDEKGKQDQPPYACMGNGTVFFLFFCLCHLPQSYTLIHSRRNNAVSARKAFYWMDKL